MVDIAVERIVIGAEALITLIIVVIDPTSCPTITLDAEVVVALTCQFAIAGTRLQHALRQRDAGRNAVLLHLTDGNILVIVEIVLICFVP